MTQFLILSIKASAHNSGFRGVCGGGGPGPNVRWIHHACMMIKVPGSVNNEQTWGAQWVPESWPPVPRQWEHQMPRESSQLCHWGDKEATQRKLLKFSIQRCGPEKLQESFWPLSSLAQLPGHSNMFGKLPLLKENTVRLTFGECLLWTRLRGWYSHFYCFVWSSQQFCKSFPHEETEEKIGVIQI